VRHVRSVDFAPERRFHFPFQQRGWPRPTSWDAPTWLFGVSIAVFGIGPLKEQNVPSFDSEQRLGKAHIRWLLKGARRLFLWELGAVERELAAVDL
jgi:hypothetical protein